MLPAFKLAKKKTSTKKELQIQKEQQFKERPTALFKLIEWLLVNHGNIPGASMPGQVELKIKDPNQGGLTFYMIHLGTQDAPKIFGNDYELVNRHITIFEKHVPPSIACRFRPHYHFTLEYIHRTTGERKRVHSFFHHNSFLYLEIDGLVIPDRTKIHPINNYCSDAQFLLENLDALMANRQEVLERDFSREAAMFEGIQLDTPLSEEAMRNGFQRCKAIFDDLKIFNEKQDDTRLIAIENTINAVIKGRQPITDSPSPSTSDSDVEELEEAAAQMQIAPTTSSTKSPKSQQHELKKKPSNVEVNVDENIKRITTTINSIEKLAKSDNVEEMEATYATIPRIEKEIASLWRRSGSDKKFLDLFDKLNRIPKLVQIFERLVKEQKLKEAGELLPIPEVNSQLQIGFFNGLFLILLNESIPETKQHEYATFCRLLSDYCDNYHLALSVAANAEYIQEENGVEIGRFFLSIIAEHSNHVIFKVLFEQMGLHAALFGCRVGTRVSSLISSVAYGPKSEDLLNFLLEEEMPCEQDSLQAIYDARLATHPPKKFASDLVHEASDDEATIKREKQYYLTSMKARVANHFTFYQACLNQPWLNVQTLVKLADQSPTFSVLYGFCALTLCLTYFELVPTNTGTRFALFSTREAFDNFINNTIEGVRNTKAKRVAYAIFINDPKGSAPVSQIWKILQDRLGKLSDEQIDELVTQLRLQMIKESKLPLALQSQDRLLIARYAILQLLHFKKPSKDNYQSFYDELKHLKNKALETFSDLSLFDKKIIQELIKKYSISLENLRSLGDVIDTTTPPPPPPPPTTAKKAGPPGP